MDFKKADVSNKLDKLYPSAKVYFSLEEIPDKNVFPAEWLELIAGNFAEDKIKPLAAWDLIKNQLPNVFAFINSYVFAYALLVENDSNFNLLYLYSTNDGQNLHFYKGGLPLRKKEEQMETETVSKFPPLLRSIYNHLHDGWAFIPGESAGFQPLDYCSLLNDDKFDIDEKVAKSYEFNTADVLTIYHNGAGDYLCLNLSRDNQTDDKAEGIIWWHEEPENPSEEGNFYEAFDAWFYFAVETAELNSASRLVD